MTFGNTKLLREPSSHPPDCKCCKRQHEGHEQSKFDPLQRPVPTLRLVRDGLVQVEAGDARLEHGLRIVPSAQASRRNLDVALRHPQVLALWQEIDSLGSCQTNAIPLFWYSSVMKTTIDKAGRLVIPKALRDRLGLLPGEVEITADGAALRVEPVFDDTLVERDGRLVIPPSNSTITDDFVRELRDVDQK